MRRKYPRAGNESKMNTQRHTARRIVAALVSLALLTGVAGIFRLWAHAEASLFADVHIDVGLLKSGAGLDPDFEFDFAREAAFITGPTIVGASLKHPAIARLETVKWQGADAGDWLSRQIRVEFPASDILRIRYLGAPSHEAARLVNAIAAAYVDEITDEVIRLRAERTELLERGRRDATKRLAEKREAIRRLEELLASADEVPGAGASPHPDQMAAWARELKTLRIAVNEGDEMVERITAELAKLQCAPSRAAVELSRPATF
jgi:hypothetical protein